MNGIERIIREIISTVLAVHPKDCVFVSDAENVIYNQVRSKVTSFSDDNFVDVLTQAFHDAEIYCPHEGIDKR